MTLVSSLSRCEVAFRYSLYLIISLQVRCNFFNTLNYLGFWGGPGTIGQEYMADRKSVV